MAPSFKVVRLGGKQNDNHPLLQHLAHSRAFLAMTSINRKKLGKSIASSKWAITVAVNQLIWHEGNDFEIKDVSGSLCRRIFLAPHSTYSKVRTTSLDLLQMSEEMSEAVLPHAQCLGFIQTF